MADRVGPFVITDDQGRELSVLGDIGDVWRLLGGVPGIDDKGLRGAVKAAAAIGVRMWNNRLKGDYPKAPVRPPDGMDFIESTVRYFVGVGADLLSEHRGVRIALAAADNPGEYRIERIIWGDEDVGRATDSGNGRTLLADARPLEAPASDTDASYLPGGPLDYRGNDRQREDDVLP